MIKILTCSLIMFMAVGCTTVTYKGPYGEVSYSSSKDVKVTFVKDGEDVTLTLEGDNGDKMELLKGVLGAMK